MADRRELWLTCCIGPADRLYVADHAHGVCLETSTKGEFGRSVFLAPEDEAKLLAFLLARSPAVAQIRAQRQEEWVMGEAPAYLAIDAVLGALGLDPAG